MIEYSNRVWSHSKQQGTKLVLLLALADMTNQDKGFCWPSFETLQEKARLAHRQNAIRSIDELENAGELWVERGRGRSCTNAYIVTVGMTPAELSRILIHHFDYEPNDALQRAEDHINKCSPQAENVAAETHKQNVASERENVAPTREKRSRGATRIRKNHNRTRIEPEVDARVDRPVEPPEPPMPPALSQSEVDEFVAATNVMAHALPPPSAAPPFQPVLDDPPSGPKVPPPTRGTVTSRFFDPRKLVNGLIGEGKGETPVEVYLEFFESTKSKGCGLSVRQMETMVKEIVDLEKWRAICKIVSLRNGKAYSMDNMLDIYLNGFRKETDANGTSKPGGINQTHSRQPAPIERRTLGQPPALSRKRAAELFEGLPLL